LGGDQLLALNIQFLAKLAQNRSCNPPYPWKTLDGPGVEHGRKIDCSPTPFGQTSTLKKENSIDEHKGLDGERINE
jgi:hypothetical protein